MSFFSASCVIRKSIADKFLLTLICKCRQTPVPVYSISYKALQEFDRSPDRSIDLLSKLHPQADCEANGTTIPFLYYKNIQSTSTDHEYHEPTDQFVPGDLYGVMPVVRSSM